MRKLSFFIFCGLLLLIFGACRQEKSEIDYSNPDFWLGNLEAENRFEADIFYVYPSLFFTSRIGVSDDVYYSDIEDVNQVKIIEKNQRQYRQIYADGWLNFYAPKYRQMMLDIYLKGEDFVREKMDLPAADVAAAFQYYMAHFNQGRPFFLLGHSQGATALIELLEHSMTQEQHSQMVAAYIFGCGVSQEQVDNAPNLIPAKDSNDVGCFIAINCVSDTNVVLPCFFYSDFSINPLNWKTDTTMAPKTMHQGWAVWDNNSETFSYTTNYTSSYLYKNRLVCPDIHPHLFYAASLEKICPLGSLHLAEPLLFAKDIKANMRCRLEYFQKEKK